MINIDSFLNLFNHPSIILFPRKAMTSKSKGQIIVNSKEELLRLIEEANYIDCFLQSHRQEDKAKGFLYLVFIDIDFKDDLNRARKIVNRILHYLNVKYDYKKPYIQFSGFKGYHIIIPIEPIEINPPTLASDFLRFMQLKLSMGYCDEQILGDIVRIIRLPNTYNSKAIAKGQDGKVKIIQDWDGNRLNVDILKEEYKLKKWEEEEKEKDEKKKSFRPSYKPGVRIRPHIQELIKKAKEGFNLTHRQRLAIVFELINNNYSDDEIMEIFKNLPDFNEQLTRYMIQHARKRGYKPFRTENLQEILQEG
jgi:hypothetical protein